MKKLTTIVSIVVLATILLSPAALAQNQNGQGNNENNKPVKTVKKQNFELNGTIASVDASMQTFTVLNPTGSKIIKDKDKVVLSVTVDTKIRRNNEKAVFADLKVGDKVNVTGKIDGEKYIARWVTASTPKFSLNGNILAIDATNKTITVKNLKGSKDIQKMTQVVIYTTADTKIWKDGKKAVFTDLKIGDKVEVTGRIETGNYTAKTINAHTVKFELTGEVVSIDTAAKKLTVTVKTGDAVAREFKDKNVVIAYTDSTKFVRSSGVTAIGDLKAGVRVNIKGTASGDMWSATRIVALGMKKAENENLTKKVEITADGFSPATITVKVGTTVKWENEGIALAWPASDPHPAHTGLAGFDALAGLAKDATYSFTFTTVGTYGYHDHLNPTHTGSVQVIQ